MAMGGDLVANELLAFLQQKLDVMDELSAIQICCTSFSEDDIAAAKLLLYRSLDKCDQMVSRRRDGTKKSLQDIITLLKETEPDDVPIFVARDLNKLPPVTFDHVDVTSLLRDIVSLKASLSDVHRKLESSQKSVVDLRTELEQLRKSVALTGSSPCDANVNTRRGAASHDTSNVSFASAILQSPEPTVAAESTMCVTRAPRDPAPLPAAPLPSAARTRPARPPLASSCSLASPSTAQPRAAAPPAKPAPEKAARADDDGFVTVQKRKRQKRTVRNCCGTAPAEPDVCVRAAAPNTPVYISRLHYTTQADDIVAYVKRKLGYVLRVQLLESRRNVNFKAFVVRVPTCLLQRVLQESFWPKDVVFRRFRGQVPPDRTKTMT